MATRIYVGNLPYSADNQQLTELFSAFGDVVEATVVMDRDSGQSKGFGFVQMGSDEGAQRAIASLNGTMLGNRTIRVNEAQPRTDRPSGGRSYGGGGGGGYGGGYDRPRRDRDGGGYDRPRRDDYSGRNYSAPRYSPTPAPSYPSGTEDDENSRSYSRHERGRDRDRARRDRDSEY